ncbi:MAG: type I DNA topoisomerase [Phycisphaerae bacterium]|nr:type I DNA topoisomerase [Phycisphaerae bacterium]
MAKSSGKNKTLVIVESPAKAKTINKYLGSDFEVKASMGHVRDLPSKGINVDIENKFEPTYAIMPGKNRTVAGLKAAAKNCDTLYLATDLDREGEAIAWHLAQILKFPSEKTYRVIFNAITKSAIKQAFDNPGKLDMDKVMAQQARRILDRIVGYQISPLLWKRVAGGLSAGRVQSVAVKLVVEKERQIRAFVPEEYWLIPAVFTADLKDDYSKQWKAFLGTGEKSPTVAEQNQWLIEHKALKAELYKVGSDKFHTDNSIQAKKIADALVNASFKVNSIDKKESTSRPSPPFTTSTLQQTAANRIGFSTHRTMRIAQQLYEGIDLGSMGTLGLITYMRTDSTHLSPESVNEVRRYLQTNLGSEYMPEKPIFYASKQNAQQAHEAIHPTDPDLVPADIKEYLTDEQYKLYDLIWRRFVASQMTAARWDVTNIDIIANTQIGPCYYRSTGRILVFDGFTKIWLTSSTEQQMPDVKADQPLRAIDITAEQNFTKPPARYTEASLVKTMEKEGIGRPSTYASIISTIQDRKYVEQIDKKFHATDLGEVVTDKLNEYFPRIMDVAFTRHMESQLDKIEEQHIDWVGVLDEFYGPFRENLEKAAEEMKHAKAETTPSEYSCPKCDKPLVYRFGKNGRFLSCSDYPNCKFASPCDSEGKILEEKQTEHKCPKCSSPMVTKHGRFGSFLGCSNYPDCKTIQKIDKEGNIMPPKEPPEPTGINCQKCKTGELVIRKSKKGPFMGCNKFPKCRNIITIKKKDELLELQMQGKWPPKTIEEADEMLGRTKKPAKKAAPK